MSTRLRIPSPPALPRLAVLVAPFLAACAPQNAVLTSGEYFGFISDSTSFSLQKGSVDPYEWGDDMWTIDCREFATAAEKNALQLTGIDDDCEEGENSERCVDRRQAKLCKDWIEVLPATDPPKYRPEHETWMAQSPWWVVHEELKPWRGEAIITSEGDLQIGFHHRLPGGGDFRFAFVVDPDFAPKQCNIDTGKAEPRDGDWVTEWTEDFVKQADGVKGLEHMMSYADGGSVFYLTADGFQFNPAETQDYWFMPEQWESGFVQGKFVEETFQSRTPRWGTNEAYEYFEVYDPSEGYGAAIGMDELYYCQLDEGESARDNPCVQGKLDFLDEVTASIQRDLSAALTPEGADKVDWSPMVHANLWRPSDGTPAGFDGWQELHYNMIAFDQTPEQMAGLQAGDSFKGAFTLVLDGIDSNSRFLLRGEFEVPRLRDDRWTTEDIRARKLEENGNTLCILD